MTHVALPIRTAGAAMPALEAIGPGTPTAGAVPIEDARVLLVDDEDATLLAMARLLERAGYWRVETAPSGRRALAAMHSAMPDVLVLDVHMPGLDGIATLRAMSNEGQMQRATSVLAVSGDATSETRRDMLAHGADDYLARPFTGRDLVTAVSRLAARTNALNRALARVSLLDGLVR